MRVGTWVSDHRKLVITILANETLPPQKKYILPPTHAEEAYQAGTDAKTSEDHPDPTNARRP